MGTKGPQDYSECRCKSRYFDPDRFIHSHKKAAF